jgi:hypothetical protein
LAACFVLLRLLLAVSGAKLRLGMLWQLHRNEVGSVQSLSFVLTLPVFIMIMMLIVQVSQLMIATVVVHYAAFSAARSAVVWIPANVGTVEETENRISSIALDPEAEMNGDGQRYRVLPGSPKYQKIELAAALACLPISPSRDVGAVLPPGALPLASSLKAMYRTLDPSSDENLRIPQRLDNKLAYALANTRIEINFLHKHEEPEIQRYYLGHNTYEFYDNEVGWQDPVKVTVTHDLALLPGPGRLLARRVVSARYPDRVSPTLQERGNIYVRSLTASATLPMEGEKSVLPYVHDLN